MEDEELTENSTWRMVEPDHETALRGFVWGREVWDGGEGEGKHVTLTAVYALLLRSSRRDKIPFPLNAPLRCPSSKR
jgi:hypothetical protein